MTCLRRGDTTECTNRPTSGVEPPKPRIEAVRIVDMSASNSWAEFAGLFRDTRQAFLWFEELSV
jgi:hypothetical protein